MGPPAGPQPWPLARPPPPARTSSSSSSSRTSSSSSSQRQPCAEPPRALRPPAPERPHALTCTPTAAYRRRWHAACARPAARTAAAPRGLGPPPHPRAGRRAASPQGCCRVAAAPWGVGASSPGEPAAVRAPLRAGQPQRPRERARPPSSPAPVHPAPRTRGLGRPHERASLRAGALEAEAPRWLRWAAAHRGICLGGQEGAAPA